MTAILSSLRYYCQCLPKLIVPILSLCIVNAVKFNWFARKLRFSMAKLRQRELSVSHYDRTHEPYVLYLTVGKFSALDSKHFHGHVSDIAVVFCMT